MKKLYFMAGLPDETELEEAKNEGALIRNSLAWHPGDAFEECDLALGRPENIPEPYRHLWQDNADENDTLPVKAAKKAKTKKDVANGADR